MLCNSRLNEVKFSKVSGILTIIFIIFVIENKTHSKKKSTPKDHEDHLYTVYVT